MKPTVVMGSLIRHGPPSILDTCCLAGGRSCTGPTQDVLDGAVQGHGQTRNLQSNGSESWSGYKLCGLDQFTSSS